MFIDVHSHLFYNDFYKDISDVLDRSKKIGLKSIIVNGLDKKSNRQTLDLKKKYPNIVKAALGIYPSNAIDNSLEDNKNSLEEEYKFISSKKDEICAIGECGLDGYNLDETTFKKQEQVFENLINISLKYDKALIVHSRKRELRTAEILNHYNAKKVILHCFSGKIKYAVKWADKYGWFFSIPVSCTRSQNFKSLVSKLPIENLLTETDAPYLSICKEIRNEPMYVIYAIQTIASIKNISFDDCMKKIYNNFKKIILKNDYI